MPRGVEKLAARTDDVWINIMRDEWYIRHVVMASETQLLRLFEVLEGYFLA